MSDSEPTPDDLLVSAVLDGVASADEAQRVASDPRLASRLAQFRAVADAVGGPVPLVDTAVRDAHLARARAAHQSGEHARATHDSGEHARATHHSGEHAHPLASGSGPPPTPPGPPPPVDLAAARAQRRRPRSTVILSVAAAVVLVVAAGAFLVRLGDSTGGGGDAEVAATAPEEAPSADAAESGGAGSEFVPAPDTGTASGSGDATTPGAPASTVPPSGIDPTLPSLGTFTKATDLAARVRGELTLEPRPADLATGESCVDDFGVEVLLLGRASVAGDEGLVYVEAAPASPRRLWLVDPGTVGADDDCRAVVPVQTL